MQANATAGNGGTTVANPMQGFSQNGKQPIHIDAAKLEVRDKNKVATFSGDAKGDVRVTQGDTVMQAKTLTVYYDQDSADGAKQASAASAASGNQRIRRLEAKGDVIVTQKDQTVTGKVAVFDTRANTVTMSGGVVLTQGQNVVQGESLVMDMTTGVSKVDPGKNGRVRTLLIPQNGSAGGSSANPLQR